MNLYLIMMCLISLKERRTKFVVWTVLLLSHDFVSLYDLCYCKVCSFLKFELQGDKLYISVCLWYLVKSDLSSARYCMCTVYISVYWKVLHRTTRTCFSGWVVRITQSLWWRWERIYWWTNNNRHSAENGAFHWSKSWRYCIL